MWLKNKDIFRHNHQKKKNFSRILSQKFPRCVWNILRRVSLNEMKPLLKPGKYRGIWVAQSVKCLTSTRVMISWFVSLSPTSGSVLTARSLEPALDSVSLSLSVPPPLVFCLSLSLKKKKKKNIYIYIYIYIYICIYTPHLIYHREEKREANQEINS